MPASLRELLDRGRPHAHLVGVGGVGMAGLARLLAARGWRVSGCDLAPGRLGRWLLARGIPVREGHDPSHLTDETDCLIRSAAVPPDAPECRAAADRGLPCWSRGEVLAALLADHGSVAVCGTHGKTTTAGFIAQILRHAGRRPSWCIGGEVPSLRGVSGVGRGPDLVVEADESDGTLAFYRPDVIVITNVEPDHLEHFGGLEALEACFRKAAEGTRRRVIVCADDAGARRVARGLPHVLTYGLSQRAAVRAERVAEGAGQVSFDLVLPREGRRMRVRMPVPGRHNVLNALAAFAAAREMGVDPSRMVSALRRAELPRRRFERVVAARTFTALSDYAHHPTEIAALVRAASRLPHRRLLAVFQPHRYTRTLALGRQFPEAFRGVARLILTPVYAAGEAPVEGGSVWDLYAHFRSGHRTLSPDAVVADSLEQAWEWCRTWLRPGDLLLIIGAGNVERLAAWVRRDWRRSRAARETPPPDEPLFLPRSEAAPLASRLPHSTVRAREPLARHTTLRVGGPADLWVEVGSRSDLVRLVGWARRRRLPLRVLGAGSNTLAPDGGVRGVTARLAGGDFLRIRTQAPRTVVAGAGVPLARLLRWLTAQGWTGLEFLEGIPGTVGGAVRMNAGAWGFEIGQRVAWVRALDENGKERVWDRSELDFAYRTCRALESRVVTEAAFDLDSAAPRDVEERRRAVARRRDRGWQARSAGSVFRNPPGDWAGRLVEAAGLKGSTLGGARISPRHANVIVTRPGATASDVRALLEIARAAVERRWGVRLETEVVLLA